jgi:ABC-2 type transport system ATP-binding protein
MSQAAVRLEFVRKRYRRRFALEGLNFEAEEGTVMGLVGPNGAGKSTLLRILVGLVRPDSGRVTVLGKSMPAEERAIKSETGFVSEDMALYARATLRWHIEFVRSLSPRWDAEYAEKLLERFRLDPDQNAGGLSRGQNVKAMLLLALARRPKLLLLDEPTAGLDPLARRELLLELKRIVREEGPTVLFSSHQTQDVADLADRVAFLSEGRLVREAATWELLGKRGEESLEDVFIAQLGGVA